MFLIMLPIEARIQESGVIALAIHHYRDIFLSSRYRFWAKSYKTKYLPTYGSASVAIHRVNWTV